MSSVSRRCSVPGCVKRYHALGYCDTHYRRLKTHGKVDDPVRLTEAEKKANAKAVKANWRVRNPGKQEEGQARWRKLNRDHIREYQRAYQKMNPEKVRQGVDNRRARLASVVSDNHTLTEVIAMYGTDCHICLEPIDMKAPGKVGLPGWERGFQKDHVVPLSKKGPNTLENVRPSHGLCNLIKNDSDSRLDDG